MIVSSRVWKQQEGFALTLGGRFHRLLPSPGLLIQMGQINCLEKTFQHSKFMALATRNGSFDNPDLQETGAGKSNEEGLFFTA